MNAELQRRRDETMRQLDRLGEQKVAATPMVGWGGEVAARHIRFVFSNEPVQRLALLGERVRAAIAAFQHD